VPVDPGIGSRVLAKLFLVVGKTQPEIELDEDDEKGFDEAMVAVRRGKTIPLETFRAILQRL
jgi:hypothetical protein